MEKWKELCLIMIFAVILALIGCDNGKIYDAEITTGVPVSTGILETNEEGAVMFNEKNAQYAALPGEPELPCKIIKVLIPPDAVWSSISVSLKNEAYGELPGTWEVSPGKPYTGKTESGEDEIIWPNDKTIVDGKDIDIYNKDADFPVNILGSFVPGQFRKYKVIDVSVNLYKYNPVTEKLKQLKNGEVVVNFTRDTSLIEESITERVFTMVTGSRSILTDTVGSSQIKSKVVNYSQYAADYTKAAQGYRSPGEPESSSQQLDGYAVITTNSIMDELNSEDPEIINEFIESKANRGFAVQIITEDIWGGDTGDAGAENIRNWLINNYIDLNIAYVLLVGDPNPCDGDVPMKFIYPENLHMRPGERFSTCVPNVSPCGTRYNVPSDFYYADLNGNWDLNDNGYYGEAGLFDCPYENGRGDFGLKDGVLGVDKNWDVIVGRIPYYGQISDLLYVFQKTIAYMNESESEAQWRKKVLIPIDPFNEDISKGYRIGEEIIDKVIKPSGLEYHRLYNNTEWLADSPETYTSPCNQQKFVSKKLTYQPGAVFWTSHGSETATAVLTSWWITPGEPGSFYNLEDSHPFIVFSPSCRNACPEYSRPEKSVSNLSYTLLLNGGIVSVASTRIGYGTLYYDSYEGRTNVSGFQLEFAKNLILDKVSSGQALHDLKQNLYIYPQGDFGWRNFVVLNLYGDPELGLFHHPQNIVEPVETNEWLETSASGKMGGLNWECVDISPDGESIAAAEFYGYIYISNDGGSSWTRKDASGRRRWKSIAMSSDGMKIVACACNGYIYNSADGGETWNVSNNSWQNWRSITSSDDGVNLAVAQGGVSSGSIYTSTDSGQTWVLRSDAGRRYWQSIASSADGTYLVASSGRYNNTDNIYASDDGGETWSALTGAGSRQWAGVASSPDGQKLAACAVNGYIYTSPDRGITWDERTNSGRRYWEKIKISPDGTQLAAINTNRIYGSSNSGATWVEIEDPGNEFWAGIDLWVSGSNKKIVAVPSGGYIAFTSHYGSGWGSAATWIEKNTYGDRHWQSIASSSDGMRLAAVVNDGYIYTSRNYGATWTERISAGKGNWSDIASSSNGMSLAVVDSLTGRVHCSKDGGVTWSQSATELSLISKVSSSSDGEILAVCSRNGYISMSTDGGTTWSAKINSGRRFWKDVDMTPDGQQIVGVVNNNLVYKSLDGGDTWTGMTASGNQSWVSVSISDDGSTIAAGTNGYLHISNDGGLTWTVPGLEISNWGCISVSDDGLKIAVAASTWEYTGSIYISTDAGATWTEQVSVGEKYWEGIVFAPDGSRITAIAELDNTIYTYVY